MEAYFAYGSNLNMKQMKSRCPDSLKLFSVVLPDHKLTFRRSVATIEPSQGEQVYGALYAVSKQDKENLDGYEGYPHLYDRKTYELNIWGTERKTQAFGYYMNPEDHEESLPNIKYFDTIMDGYDDWGLPMDFLIIRLDKLRQKGVE